MYVCRSNLPSRQESMHSASARPLRRCTTIGDLQTAGSSTAFGVGFGAQPPPQAYPIQPSSYLDVEVGPPPFFQGPSYDPVADPLPPLAGSGSIPKARIPQRPRIPPDYTNSAFVAGDSWHSNVHPLQFQRPPANPNDYGPPPIAGFRPSHTSYANGGVPYVAHI